MKSKRQPKKRPEVPAVRLGKKAEKNIDEVAEELGCSAECAVNIMIVCGLMLLGDYESEQEYLEAVRYIEKQFGVSVEDRLPKYIKGGDAKYIASLEKFAAKKRAKKKSSKKK